MSFIQSQKNVHFPGNLGKPNFPIYVQSAPYPPFTSKCQNIPLNINISWEEASHIPNFSDHVWLFDILYSMDANLNSC